MTIRTRVTGKAALAADMPGNSGWVALLLRGPTVYHWMQCCGAASSGGELISIREPEGEAAIAGHTVATGGRHGQWLFNAKAVRGIRFAWIWRLAAHRAFGNTQPPDLGDFGAMVSVKGA